MLVFDKAHLVFLSVPKTGTTAYQRALGPHASMIISDPPILKHSPVFRYNRFFRPVLEKFVSDDLTVLAVMRHPIDWLGSWYRYRQRPSIAGKETSTAEMSFDEFVQAYSQGQQPEFANVGSQGKFLEPQKNGTKITHLFRYEDQDGLQRFLKAKLGIDFELEQRNVSPSGDLTLSVDTEAKYRQKYARDFAVWEGIGENGAHMPVPRLDQKNQ